MIFRHTHPLATHRFIFIMTGLEEEVEEGWINR